MTDTAADDALLRVYNQELIALSSKASSPRLLSNPDAMARAISPICGSEVSVSLKINDGRVVDFGFEVEACALTKCVLAVMNDTIRGKTRAEIFAAGELLRAMLAGENVLPTGDWAALKILQPVVDYKARHNAIMLPFEAVEKAFLSV